MSDLFMAGIYEQVTRQLKDGKAFVLEAPDHVPSVWGEDADVIWSEGEPLFVVGPSAASTDTSSTDTSATDSSSQLADLLSQRLQQSELSYAVSQAQYGVLSGMIGNLPPFGGSFLTGGVVPGMAGEARTIIAHGGESVVPAGGGQGHTFHVIVQDGAVDAKRIQVIANGEAQREEATKPTSATEIKLATVLDYQAGILDELAAAARVAAAILETQTEIARQLAGLDEAGGRMIAPGRLRVCPAPDRPAHRCPWECPTSPSPYIS